MSCVALRSAALRCVASGWAGACAIAGTGGDHVGVNCHRLLTDACGCGTCTLSADDFIQKGTKLPRDPNAPAPKVSAYMYFSQKQREAMAKKKGPSLDFTAAGTAIGKAWSELGDAGKKPFEALAAKDADRHDREMAKYKPSAKFTAEIEACKKNSKYAPRLKKVRTDYTVARTVPLASFISPASSIAVAG